MEEVNMRNLVIGIAIGITIGVVGTATAAQIVGDSGYLSGWEVTKGGETICSSPYVWPSLREIDCD
jgi:hypothetical protein